MACLRPAIPPSSVRQLPWPPYHTAGDGDSQPKIAMKIEEDHENPEMAGDNCVSVDRVNKPKRSMNMESLPDEMVAHILLQLPAEDIYDLTRLVCWKWYNMINTHNFIYEHLNHSSTNGVLVQVRVRYPIFISMRQQGNNCFNMVVSKFRFWFIEEVWSSCNGLVLVNDIETNRTLYIVNPATKQHLGLPPFFREIRNHKHSGLAYSPDSTEYKVVVTHKLSEGYNCFVITAGVDDSWKDVSVDHLSSTARALLGSTPLNTEGFLHWYSDHVVVTLNVETEILKEIPVPVFSCGESRRKTYLSTGGGSCCLSCVIECSNFLWELWEINPQTGEWTKLPSIELEARKWNLEEQIVSRFGEWIKMHKSELGAQKRRLRDELFSRRECSCIHPIGWLKYKEVMMFAVSSPSRLRIAYDVRARKMHSLELDTKEWMEYNHVAHMNSLVWLD